MNIDAMGIIRSICALDGYRRCTISLLQRTCQCVHGDVLFPSAKGHVGPVFEVRSLRNETIWFPLLALFRLFIQFADEVQGN